jgi:hypothetical protein
MQNRSSWQWYGWLIRVCTGVYILSCGARSIPIGCGYGGTLWPPNIGTVMLLFRPFCTCSCTRCANQKHSSHGASCRTLTLGTVLQHHPHATERIATLRFAQRRKIAFKIFLGGYRLSRLFQSPDHNSSELYLIIHSDQSNKLSKAWAVTFLIFPALLPMKVTPRQTHFSLWHLLKKGSCA